MFDPGEVINNLRKIEAETKQDEITKKQQNEFDTVFFNQLQVIDDEINKQKELKIDVIERLLDPILKNCKFFEILFKNNSDNIQHKIKAIGKELNFEITNNSQQLGITKIFKSIEDCFPIRNNSNGFISDDCPKITEDWIIQTKSSATTLEWFINPIDNSERYPQDPDDNPFSFDYKIPLSVHEGSLVEGKRGQVLTKYFDNIIYKQLLLIKDAIIVKQKVLSTTIESINFNDPILVAELRKKIKNVKFIQ